MDKTFFLDSLVKFSISDLQSIEYSKATQKSYYPDDPCKENQDILFHQTLFGRNGKSMEWFSVFDGHGSDGHHCTRFASVSLAQQYQMAAKNYESAGDLNVNDISKYALIYAHISTHKELVGHVDINSSRSGTTATTLLFLSDVDICVLAILVTHVA